MNGHEHREEVLVYIEQCLYLLVWSLTIVKAAASVRHPARNL
jgi:hypothetical protein